MGAFTDMLGDDGPDAFVARREAAWEQTVVRHLAAAFKIPTADLARWQRENAASAAKLSLAAFAAVCPTFPYALYARRVPYAAKALAADLFAGGARADRFFKGRLYVAWRETADLAGDTRKPVGVVFPFPGARFLVLHDGGAADRRPPYTTVTTAAKAGAMTIEPLRQLTAAVASSGWAPGW